MGRALAALAVVAFHLSLAFNDPRYGGTALWLEFTRHGWHGVDFFFALSGFIILHAHYQDIGRADQLGRYAAKRFFRIYPIYWMLTALVLVIGAGAVQIQKMNGGDLASTFSLIRFTSSRTPLVPAWTLFHEIFFYALFAIGILRIWAGVAIFLAWLALIVLFGSAGLPDKSFAAVVVSPLNLSFFAGMGAYLVYAKLTAARSVHFFVAGLILFIALALWGNLVLTRLFYCVFMGTAFFLLISGVVALEKHGMVGEVRWLSAVGNASYVLYLMHLVVMTGLLKFAHLAGLMPILGPKALYVIVLAFTTISCVGVHLAVEKPLQKILTSRLPKPKLFVKDGAVAGAPLGLSASAAVPRTTDQGL